MVLVHDFYTSGAPAIAERFVELVHGLFHEQPRPGGMTRSSQMAESRHYNLLR
jgi:hypothetical protein